MNVFYDQDWHYLLYSNDKCRFLTVFFTGQWCFVCPKLVKSNWRWILTALTVLSWARLHIIIFWHASFSQVHVHTCVEKSYPIQTFNQCDRLNSLANCDQLQWRFLKFTKKVQIWAAIVNFLSNQLDIDSCRMVYKHQSLLIKYLQWWNCNSIMMINRFPFN